MVSSACIILPVKLPTPLKTEVLSACCRQRENKEVSPIRRSADKPLTTQEKNIIAALLAVLLFICSFLGYRHFSYHRETVLLRRGEKAAAAIYINPDNSATRAAANYLSYSVEQALGTEISVVTEKKEDTRYISIVCGAEPEAAAEETAYSVFLDRKKNVTVYTPKSSRCFGAVKAISDRWLQENCGLRNWEDLRISQAMIDEDLSLLSTTVTGEIRILSQNLCYSDGGSGLSVTQRAKRFFQLVEEYQPDLIGTQECSLQWKNLLENGLGDRYEFYGISRVGPDIESGEWNAILYRKDRFEFRDGGTFWLSNTPDEPRSQLNYEGVYRICTWILLTDTETEKTMLYSNTHLQNGGGEGNQEVRARQAEILLRYLRRGDNKLNQNPGFLTGDFNGTQNEAFYSEITQYYEDAEKVAITNSSAVDYSYHEYGATQWLLDYCFNSPKKVAVLDYHILDDQFGGYVSDHYGLLVTAVLN